MLQEWYPPGIFGKTLNIPFSTVEKQFVNQQGNIANRHHYHRGFQTLLSLCISQMHSRILQTHLLDYFLNYSYLKE
jgi:hypothetical protein